MCVIAIATIGIKFDLYNATDFIDGIFVETHAIIIEIIIVVLLLGWWTSYRETKIQHPARILASKKLIELHIEAFTFLKYLIDPNKDANLDLSSSKQEKIKKYSNALVINLLFRSVPQKLKKCQKMLTYTNASLGVELLPKIVTYLDYAENQMSNFEKIVKAYGHFSHEGKNTRGEFVEYHFLIDFHELKEMDKIYQSIIQSYPQLETFTPDLPPIVPISVPYAKTQLPIDELLGFIRKAQKEQDLYKIEIINDE